jgi:hypothetical protein
MYRSNCLNEYIATVPILVTGGPVGNLLHRQFLSVKMLMTRNASASCIHHLMLFYLSGSFKASLLVSATRAFACRAYSHVHTDTASPG